MEKLSLEHKLWKKIQLLFVQFHTHLKISTEERSILFFFFFLNVNANLIVFRLQL